MATAQESFVGRVAELDALARAYAQASDGQLRDRLRRGAGGNRQDRPGPGVPGCDRGGLVILASGDEAEMTLPWGMLSQLALGSRAAGAGPLGQLGKLSPGADPLAAGRLLLDSLGELASGGPVVLVVEDLHWIDHPSAQALRFALRRLERRAGPGRADDPAEGPAQLDEGWRRLLDDRGERLRLRGLAWPEVAQLVSALGGVTLSGPAVRRLWRHTCGNPLYTRCLIEELDPAALARPPGRCPLPGRSGTAGGPAGGVRPADTGPGLGRQRCSANAARSPRRRRWPSWPARLTHWAKRWRQGCWPRAPTRMSARSVSPPAGPRRDLCGSDPARRAALHLSAARFTAGAVALAHRVAAAAARMPPGGRAGGAGRSGAGRGLHASAARHLINAADLSPEPAPREDRLLAACTVWLRSGAVHEVSSRRELLETMAPSPRLDHIRGFLAHLEGRPEEARTALRAALDQLQADPPQKHPGSEAAHRLAGLAVFDWDWHAALALVHSVPGTGSRLSLLIRCIALTMAGRSGRGAEPAGRRRTGALAAAGWSPGRRRFRRGLVRRSGRSPAGPGGDRGPAGRLRRQPAAHRPLAASRCLLPPGRLGRRHRHR